jgi:hypothetical protein
MILPGNNDYKSWRHLSYDELSAVAYGLEGHILVMELIRLKIRTETEQQCRKAAHTSPPQS